MKLRCAVLGDFQNVAQTLADWSPIADDVDVVSFRDHPADADALVAAIADFDIVITLRERISFPAETLARLPRMRLLIASGMRNSVIDFDAASQAGVVVCGTQSSSTPPVELTWALLLGLARQIVRENEAFRSSGPWQSTVGADLHGSRLGLLGLGKIGSAVAAVGLAFGMQVSAWSQNLTAERAAEVGVTLAPSKDDLLATSDFVSVHLALSPRTVGLIGARELSLMKPDAYLVNTSRSAIVDHDALLAALNSGHLAGAGVDVFDIEPVPVASPFRAAPRLLATPHLGYVTKSNYRTYYQQAVEDIRAFLDGTPVRVLNPPTPA